MTCLSPCRYPSLKCILTSSTTGKRQCWFSGCRCAAWQNTVFCRHFFVTQTQCDLVQQLHPCLSEHHFVLLLFPSLHEPEGWLCFSSFISLSRKYLFFPSVMSPQLQSKQHPNPKTAWKDNCVTHLQISPSFSAVYLTIVTYVNSTLSDLSTHKVPAFWGFLLFKHF